MKGPSCPGSFQHPTPTGICPLCGRKIASRGGRIALHAEKREKPGDHGVSPSGIPYTVRPDGSRSFVGYGGAFD